MTKTITTQELGQAVDRIIEDVNRGDQFVIQRDGKPVAAVVPIEEFEERRVARQSLMELVTEVSSKNWDKTQTEVDEDVAAAVSEYRAELQAPKQR